MQTPYPTTPRPKPIGLKSTGLKRQVLGFLLFVLWPAMAGGQPQDADPSASERLDTLLKQIDTLTVNFQQTLLDEEGEILEESSGIAYLARPKRFRWEYRAPYRLTIVADGDRVWFHDHELAQVIVKPWDAFTPDTPAAILTMSRPLAEIFEIEDLDQSAAGAQPARQWVALTPKSPEATFARAEVGFGEKGIEAMQLLDTFGQTTWLVFSGLTVNQKLEPELFSFTPPEGVDVVEGNKE